MKSIKVLREIIDCNAAVTSIANKHLAPSICSYTPLNWGQKVGKKIRLSSFFPS